jgi:phosphoglycolate phosphatase-like HAD superfamily hydrolase
MEEYEAVVYDLDGTLVRLDVDWARTRRSAATKLSARGMEVEDDSLWDLLERGNEEGFGPVVERAIAEHEREGAHTAERLPPAEELPLDVPVGVCSLNCEAACRIALEMQGLDGYVDTVVGRDTVETHKPDPEPLLSTIRSISVSPADTLFVGDSERDARTAQRAGVDFEFVADRYRVE